MKKVGNKLLSVVLILAMVCSMLWTNGKADTAKAAETVKTDGELFFELRYGATTCIQVNTNLPSNTPIADFTAWQNGCSIDESKNQYKNVGWISMANPDADKKIVLTFNFNNEFQAGQTYVLPKGAIFGFTDGKKYELDGDYTFTFDGSNWNMSVERPEITRKLTANYTAENLVQFKDFYDFGVNANDTPLTFKGQVLLDGTEITNPQFVGYPNCAIICLKGLENHKGKALTIKAGSEISYLGKTVKISQTFHATWDATTWTKILYQEGERELTTGYTEKDVVQFDNFYDFGVPENNTPLTFEGTVKLDGVKVDNPEFIGYPNITTICLNIAHGGKTLTIEAGSTLSYDGIAIKISKDFNGTWDGKKWNPIMKGEKDLKTHYVESTLVQFKDFYDFGVPENNTPLTFEGTVKLDGVKVDNPEFIGYPNITTICLNIAHEGKVLTIVKGSVLSYNGIGVKISNTFNAKWDRDNGWVTADLPESDVEGDANGDLLTDVCDLVYLKKALKGSHTTNNQCDLDGNGKYTETDVRYLRMILAYGSMQNVDLLAEARFAGGEDFITFADIPANANSKEEINKYKALGFNTALVTEDYGMGDRKLVASPSEESKDNVEKNGNVLTLSYRGFYNDKTLHFATNLPADKTYTQNWLGSTADSSYDVKQSGSQKAQFFTVLKTDATPPEIYLTVNFTNAMEHGQKYVLEAGSTFTFNGETYYLDKSYTIDFYVPYRRSIENINNAGMNVWIRNHSNMSDYFTEDITALLNDYKDIIDGVYINDEPFMTDELLNTSITTNNKEEHTIGFDGGMPTLYNWFNTNFSNTYFHVNHVPITSWNHYRPANSDNKTPDISGYKSMFDTYVNDVLKKVNTSSEKKTIGFDLYPFGYYRDEEGKILFIPTTTRKEYTEGIEPYYLSSMLVPATVAKENDAKFSVAIQTINQFGRVVDTADEITFQLYTSMACGAKQFEYFTYNSGSGVTGIINEDGSNRIYDQVKEANTEAFAFSDVLNTFQWQGAKISSGTSTNKNKEGIDFVKNTSTKLLLENNQDGVLSSIASNDDAIVGYYSKNNQDGYMVANYNDPKVVKTTNTVTLTFADCTRARVYVSKGGKLTSEVVTLTNGQYTCEVAPGSGFFIIPA